MVSLYDWDDSTHLCMTEALFAYNDYVYGRGVFEGVHDADDVEQDFMDLDTNEDGGISIEELEVVAGERFDTADLHAYYDADQSGSIDLSEYEQMHSDYNTYSGFFDGMSDEALEEILDNAYEIVGAVEKL